MWCDELRLTELDVLRLASEKSEEYKSKFAEDIVVPMYFVILGTVLEPG